MTDTDPIGDLAGATREVAAVGFDHLSDHVGPPWLPECWLSVEVETTDGRRIASSRVHADIDASPASRGEITMTLRPNGNTRAWFDGTSFAAASAEVVGWDAEEGGRWWFKTPVRLDITTFVAGDDALDIGELTI
jgi:hypothetical protein